jgi:hypothetical protein
MGDTFTAFSLANVQLVAMQQRRNKVGAIWGEKLRPKLHAVCSQIAQHKGMLFNDLNWEWAYFDANKQLLLGKVDERLAPALYLTDLVLTDLILFEQQRYQVLIQRPLSDDPEEDKWLQLMKGPAILPSDL